MATKPKNAFGKPMPFEKSKKDVDPKNGPKEGSKKEEMMDKKQMKQMMKGKTK